MGQVEILHVGGSGFAVKVGQKSGAIDTFFHHSHPDDDKSQISIAEFSL